MTKEDTVSRTERKKNEGTAERARGREDGGTRRRTPSGDHQAPDLARNLHAILSQSLIFFERIVKPFEDPVRGA